MKMVALRLIVMASIFFAGSVESQEPPKPTPQPASQINALLIGLHSYMMPKKIAAGILIAQEKNLDPNVLLNQARELVKRNYATVKNLPGVTTGSGRRAVSESELMSLEIEPVVGPTGDVVHVSVAYKNDKGRLSTSGKTKAGGAIYLGSIDRGDETLEMVFITCAIQR